MLKNPDFDSGEWTRETHTGQEFGEIYVPEGWVAWWEEGEYRRPEMKVIPKKAPFLDPPRIDSGDWAFQSFTFYGKQHAGLYQVVEGLEPGAEYEFKARAHAWSTTDGMEHSDNPACSAGVGCGPVYLRPDDVPPLNGDPSNDAIGNFKFDVGVSFGEPDPFGTVKWSSPACIYNVYHDVPPVRFTTPDSGRVVLYLRARSMWAFRSSDAYWDSCELVKVEDDMPSNGDGEWKYNTVLSGMKLGVHAIRPNRVQEFVSKLAEAGVSFPVIKAVDDLGWLQFVDDNSVILARYTSEYEGCQGVLHGDLDVMAEQLVSVILNKASAEDLETVDYWEISNEPDPNSPEGYAALGRLMIKCMERAEQNGLKLALLGLNAGTPEWDEMKAMIETGMFERAKAGGHILALHEGVFEGSNPKQYWGDRIPGAPEVEGAGALNFRYRYLYSMLKQRQEVIPLVVSEWYCGDEQSIDTQKLREAVLWYSEEAGKDYYMWAFCPFTLGPTSQWNHTDYERVYAPYLVEDMIGRKDWANAPPPGGGEEEPMEKYDRHVIMADPTYMSSDELDEAYKLGRELLRTVTPSWNDAVQVERPSEWGTNTVYAGNMAEEDRERYRKWVEERDPETVLVFQGKPLVRDVRDSLPVNQGSPHYPWKKRTLSEITHIFVHHTAGSAGSTLEDVKSIAQYHAHGPKNRPGICYTYMIGVDGSIWYTSTIENVVFAQGTTAHPGDENRFGLAICLFGNFTGGNEPTPEQMLSLERLISALRSMLGRDVPVWGHKDVAATMCPGDTWPWKDEWGKGSSNLMMGLHDTPGGEWMADNGLKGCCLALAQVSETPRTFDWSRLKDAGVTVIARVDWGYADGTGSLPKPEHADAWVNAVIGTINNSRGAAGWIIGNEINNPTEWPGGYPNVSHVITPDYYIKLFNRIRAGVSAPLAPFAVDPFNVIAGEFGQPSDPKDWAQTVYRNIGPYDFVALHAKTQTNDPAECWSDVMFTHPPLLNRFLHLRTIENQLDWMPIAKPVYVTELNPQLKSGGGMGWDSGNAEWVRQAWKYLETQPVKGAMLYRYEMSGGGQEGFSLIDKPEILQVLREGV